MSAKPRKNLSTPELTLFLTSEFSQWYPSRFVGPGEEVFSHAEQWMMVGKARLFGDEPAALRILASSEPDEQKRIGREVKGFDKAVWDKHARPIVKEGNRLKFTQNPHLWEVMKASAGTRLVEAAGYDPIWGIGLGAEDPRALDPSQWAGSNWLGDALTELRDELIASGFEPEPLPLLDQKRLSLRDERGQRDLWISLNELAAQRLQTAPQCVSSILILSASHPSTPLSVSFAGRKEPISLPMGEFYDRHHEHLCAAHDTISSRPVSCRLRR